MSENLSITKYITGIEEVFNPHVAYKGAYGFSAEVFFNGFKLFWWKKLG